MDAQAQTGTVRVETGARLNGRYRLITRIGAGGMATIYHGRDETLERDVAVKVLHPHLAEDEVLQQRFRTEARHAAALLHPNIVNVFDQGVATLPYIVMEYVDGPSLRDVLLARGRLSPGETLTVIEAVCAALDRAHATGLVHRDIKPENVLVAPDGTPKVADFGIARAVAETTLTQTGTLIGSVHYMAPELVTGQEATAASDQYAVGVLLFELLTGRKALTGDTPAAVAARHTRERIPAPSQYVSDAPRALDKVVARATAPDPRKRYPDTAALARAAHEAIPGGPRPVQVPVAPEEGREQTLVVPAEAQDTIALAATDDVEARQPPATRRRWRQRKESRAGIRRRRAALVPLLALLLLGVAAAGAYSVWNYAVAPLTEVPRLVGMTEEQAAAELETRGLELVVADSVHRLDHPVGTVLGQEPSDGAELRRGGAVSVVVSAGPESVPMPEVIRRPADEAIALLEGDGFHFSVRVDEDWNDTIDAGHVAGQHPGRGEEVAQGSTVIINVSLGVEQVVVPDLAGMSREQAEGALAEAQLQGEFREEWNDEVPEAGMVVSQSIEANSEADKGTVVAVVVSRGPLTIQMPNVEGKAIGAARDELQALGLQVRINEQPRPMIGPFRHGQFGRVEHQEPRPGESVRRGETVTLWTFSEAAEQNG